MVRDGDSISAGTGSDELELSQDPPSLPLTSPPEALFEQLRARIAEEPSARATPLTRYRAWLAWVGLPLVAALALLADMLLRHRSLVRIDASRIFRGGSPGVLLAFALALLSTAAVVSRGRASLGQPVRTLRAVFVAVSVVSLLISLAFVLLADGQEPVEVLNPYGLPCVTLAGVIAVAGSLLLAVLLRHTVVTAVGWRSLALGCASAAWAAFSLLLHCSSTDLKHSLIGHWLPVVLFPLVIAPIVSRIIKL